MDKKVYRIYWGNHKSTKLYTLKEANARSEYLFNLDNNVSVRIVKEVLVHDL